MKKANRESEGKWPRVPRKGSLRATIRGLVSKWINHQSCGCKENREKLHQKVQDLEDLIDIIARELARRSK
ncbi:MAG: hypothetical protein AB1813_03950 [Verrucomicrobiota bacterium]